MFSQYSAQKEVEKLGEITNEAMKLYVKDTLKRPFKYGEYISVIIYSDSTSSKLHIETIDKDFELYKKSVNYKWFTFQKKNIIVFCGFNSLSKCQAYFDSLNFNVDEENNTEISDQQIFSGIVYENTKLWILGINKDYKIFSVSGKIIEAEIFNPRQFKKFLNKLSSLKLYQLYEGGDILPKKNRRKNKL